MPVKFNRNHNNFDNLVAAINQVHTKLFKQVHLAINIGLTTRNWFVGCYIAEYELHGADRAQYGEKLLFELSINLKHLSNCNRRQLYDYLKFYRTYPQIVSTLSAQLQPLLPEGVVVLENKVPTPSAQLHLPAEQLISNLSYSVFKLLVDIDDEVKRAFYETECIHSNWSVRELKRQINSLYYERSGLSLNKQKLSELANQTAEQSDPALAIRDPYIFEFLGLKAKEVMGESHLEDELLDKIQEFLLELGHGFCFESRQKRILIGNNYYFIDLVFYHRILKCHVLVELKLAEFNHENIGQLNTYVSWFKKNITTDGDNPPIGILLCTDKDHALVEYALSDMDDNLFVSKYQLELPKKEDMQRFIVEKLQEMK